MEEFKDLKELWHSDKAENLPGPKEFERTLSKHRKNRSFKLLGVVTGLVFCMAGMAYVVFFNPSSSWQTYIGGSMLMAVTLYTITFKYRTWQNKKRQETLTIRAYIEELQKEKSRDFYRFPYKYAIVLLGAFFGSCLYFYPLLSSDYSIMIIGYSALLLFFLVAWFFYRPFMRNQYWKKNNRYINYINSLKNQLK